MNHQTGDRHPHPEPMWTSFPDPTDAYCKLLESLPNELSSLSEMEKESLRRKMGKILVQHDLYVQYLKTQINDPTAAEYNVLMDGLYHASKMMQIEQIESWFKKLDQK